MFKDLKRLLQFFIVTAVSMFLFPTILRLLGFESFDVQNISTLLILAGIVSSTISGAIAVIIIYKSKNAERLLQNAAARDAIWNEDSLKVQTRSVFYKVLTAWTNEDASLIKECVTDEYFQFFKIRLATKNEAKVTNIVNSIDISETRIICCQDFVNNEEDKFVGYISWNFSNNDNEEEDSEGPAVHWGNKRDNDPTKFSEIYHFVRVANDWLLNKSDDKLGFRNLLTEKSIYEE
jgi:predicted lipid-binding transport protein (Tim44 family)